jgi:hypothetical protein
VVVLALTASVLLSACGGKGAIPQAAISSFVASSTAVAYNSSTAVVLYNSLLRKVKVMLIEREIVDGRKTV